MNLFDTGRAARALGFESFGLAYLLKRFCGVTANKEFQLADWRCAPGRALTRRVRPLTREMQKYAREDTHFLLFLADELRALLQAQAADGSLVAPSPRFNGRSARSSTAARS